MGYTEQAVTFARRVLHYWVIALFEILNLCLRTYFRGSNKLDSTKHVEALVGNKGEVRRAGTTGAVGTCIPVNKWQINLEILIISVARFQQIKQIKLKSRKVFHKIPYGLLNIFIPVTVEGFSWPWSCRKPVGTCGFLPTISTKWCFFQNFLFWNQSFSYSMSFIIHWHAFCIIALESQTCRARNLVELY